MKINYIQGGLTDISAKKEALLQVCFNQPQFTHRARIIPDAADFQATVICNLRSLLCSDFC